MASRHSRKALETFIVNPRADQRAQELNILKLALAALAVRLDAFEARVRRRLTVTKPEPSKLSSPDIGLAKPIAEPTKNTLSD